MLYACTIHPHPPSNTSLFVRRRDLPSFLRSSSRWMTSHASPSSVLTHARTHECARRSRERARGGKRERESGGGRTDVRPNRRTDGRGLCYSELRHQERESTLICCLLLLDSRGGAALGDAEDACHLRQKAQSMSQSEVTNDPRCIAISGERGAREGAREPACSRAMRGLSTTNYRSEGPLNFAARQF